MVNLPPTCQAHDFREMCEQLLGQPIDEEQNGGTAMYWAQYYLREDAMQLLLDRGADPNRRESVGQFTPLHASAFHEEDCVGSGPRRRRWP